MKEETIEYVAFNTPSPSYCVIGLHGLGASGHALRDFAKSLPTTRPIRWVFPHAAVRKVSLCQDQEITAWYNVYGRSVDSQEDKEGIPAASAIVHRLINQEIQNGIQAEKIILAGFSQGAALALYAGLRYPERLGGIVALSGYLPLPKLLKAEAHPANQKVPIFMAHGHLDVAVPLALNSASLDCLKSLGYLVEFHRYPIAHTVCLREIMDISLWINSLEKKAKMNSTIAKQPLLSSSPSLDSLV